ncbi:acyl-ACP--UDP-N-acetylglucosamine O-acyltransferase [Tuwongella immobilis]|uniref:UDP N-acetylglucosamine O-acyltransferase C-terminal domain-containing protein n=1 Tax=Tuwongella immobilis TaxID=692036 RepID=A0A6C2YL97_9BACT|nr:acyl-ACP--UDP-N-acetylglucosamine O-acyltransferase [Tuwongella immobilis]VIP02348.1 udp-n-acetylglucosamine acyltransferase : Acyl-[acyl-carrier-protein]--UDP-N-acetylglucosamine O-acyltransferase OS=Isosphaera pallida (strain ATCC 43644 / DSM 9630 / IS1B) GN=Isop_3621 PE=4 SV=1: Hexapep: Hexapep: Hexapep: Acetyltransf_11 [Tuwongella immobilis]VTS01130.1 udp-n-acetylglucosamine acyltransferase : Acyl-[acyl-carrier-protein]--UDP-N-acetylglucosamine O-acyltransferase OS=Isosphaera pallida (stra
MASRIHPTAVISSEAQLADGVEVGPYVVIEGPVQVGTGTILRPFTHLIGPLTIGEGNDIGTGTVIGGKPQHAGYQNEPTSTIVGNHNIFREHVTIHRGSHAGTGVTKVGDHNYFMANAHVAHDCEVGNHCYLINNACLGGHVLMADRSMVSGNSAVHQWCRVGRLSLVSGTTSASKDVPPFMIVQRISQVTGINLVGLRRSQFSQQQIQAIKHAYRVLYRSKTPWNLVIPQLEAEYGLVDVIAELLQFIRTTRRGVCHSFHEARDDRENAAA